MKNKNSLTFDFSNINLSIKIQKESSNVKEGGISIKNVKN